MPRKSKRSFQTSKKFSICVGVFEWVFLRGCLSRFVFYKADEGLVEVIFKIDLKLTTVAGGENSYSNSPWLLIDI